MLVRAVRSTLVLSRSAAVASSLDLSGWVVDLPSFWTCSHIWTCLVEANQLCLDARFTSIVTLFSGSSHILKCRVSSFIVYRWNKQTTDREQLAETMTFVILQIKRLVSSLCHHCVHILLYICKRSDGMILIQVYLQSSVFPCWSNCLWYKPRASSSDET